MIKLADKTEAELDMIIDWWSAAIGHDRIYAYGCSESLARLNLLPPEALGTALTAIVDSNPALWGTQFLGWPVVSPEELKNQPGKVVIFADAYRAIAQDLTAWGLEEGRDFIHRDAFLSVVHFQRKGQIFLPQSVNIPVTTRCTLRCRDCCFTIPYLKTPQHTSLDNLSKEAELLFSHTERLRNIAIVGGEPLCHPECGEYIRLLGEKYLGRQLASILVITNGTLMPDERLLELMKTFQVHVNISDYSAGGIDGYDKKLTRLAHGLEEAGIEYDFYRHKWIKAAGQPTETDPAALGRRYSACIEHAQCYGYYQGRLTACSNQIFAELSGRVPKSHGGAFDLAGLDRSPTTRRALLKFALGHCSGGYLTGCNGCYGNTTNDPHLLVTPALQMERMAAS